MTASNYNRNYINESLYRRVSSGAAFDMDFDFEPQKVVIHNLTALGTAGNAVKHEWFKGMADATSISTVILEDDGTTGDASPILTASNGITVAEDSGGVDVSRFAISGITAAEPPVVTTAAHGREVGSTGRVRITNVLGMTEVNAVSRNPYYYTILSSTTFSLQDEDGNDIDASGFSAYTSGGSANFLDHTGDFKFDYEARKWVLTLGTSVAGADDDVLFIEVTKSGEYVNQGKP